MNWILPKPSASTERSLRKWAMKQMEQGIPRQIVCDYLLSTLGDEYSEEEPFAVQNVEWELNKVMADRNVQGRNLEKTKETDKAIELYEANVIDWFKYPFPYERLCLIYSRQQRYSDAIRVCKTYIKILDAFINNNDPKQDDLKDIRESIINRFQKLEKKNQTERR